MVHYYTYKHNIGRERESETGVEDGGADLRMEVQDTAMVGGANSSGHMDVQGERKAKTEQNQHQHKTAQQKPCRRKVSASYFDGLILC